MTQIAPQSLRTMSQRKRNSVAVPAPTSLRPTKVTLILLAVVVGIAGLVSWNAFQARAGSALPSRSGSAMPAAASAAHPSAPEPPLAPATAPARPAGPFERLTGKWQRPDGGYVLEITAAGEGGKLVARYLNPRPIQVSKAQASTDDAGAIKVFVELQGANYPGSTYDLTYDPASDQLKGIYFQAALRQRFEVNFERIK